MLLTAVPAAPVAADGGDSSEAVLDVPLIGGPNEPGFWEVGGEPARLVADCRVNVPVHDRCGTLWIAPSHLVGDGFTVKYQTGPGFTGTLHVEAVVKNDGLREVVPWRVCDIVAGVLRSCEEHTTVITFKDLIAPQLRVTPLDGVAVGRMALWVLEPLPGRDVVSSCSGSLSVSPFGGGFQRCSVDVADVSEGYALRLNFPPTFIGDVTIFATDPSSTRTGYCSTFDLPMSESFGCVFGWPDSDGDADVYRLTFLVQADLRDAPQPAPWSIEVLA